MREFIDVRLKVLQMVIDTTRITSRPHTYIDAIKGKTFPTAFLHFYLLIELGYNYLALHSIDVCVYQSFNKFEEAQYWLDHASSMADHWKEPLLQSYVLLCRGYLLQNQQRLGDAHTVALAALDLLRRLASRELHDAAALVAQLEEALAL